MRRRLAVLGSFSSLLGTLHAAWAQPQAAAGELRIAGPRQDAQAWVALRLITEVYRQSGLKLKLVPLPPLRGNIAVMSGQVEGELMRVRAYGEQYPELLRVEPAFYRIGVRAFSLTERKLQVRSREDLASYSIGALRGISYVGELTARLPKVNLAQTSEQMFRMLQAGRVDLVLEGQIGGQHSAALLGMKALAMSPELMRFELFHYLQPRLTAEAARLGDTLRRMRASGELDRLTVLYEAAVMDGSARLLDEGAAEPASGGRP